MLHCAFHHKIHSFMILIADSGSTKTDWCYGTEISNCKIIQTEGINPFHQSAEKIESIICQGLIPQLDFPLERCTAIYFYGAGCLPPKTESIIHVLQNNFPEADISVDTDLLGAARALCKDNAGIACILGTGSNSCLYDGKQIIQNISPLGYILGDEGSGAYLGKRFISDCLKGQLPEILRNGLLEKLNLTVPEILDKVYRQPEANRFLASLTTYIHEHKNMPQVHTFLLDCFGEFFRRNVMPYHRSLPVSFVGSIAWFFHDELTETANSYNIPLGIFIKNPISELIQYHFRISK